MEPSYRIFCLFLVCTTIAAADSGDKVTLGYIEPIRLDARLGLELEAKLDTGADSSSLDAHDIRRVRVGEKRYIRFSVEDPATGELTEFRKPYVGRVRIKRHSGQYQRRYVVRMQVCVGSWKKSIDVNLIDREYFDYPMLLGRSALEGWSVIDPAQERTTQPTCWTRVTDTPGPGDTPAQDGVADSNAEPKAVEIPLPDDDGNSAPASQPPGDAPVPAPPSPVTTD